MAKKKSAKKSAPEKPAPAGDPKRLTLAHVTHEAVEQLGGIGTVLEGLMISPVYQQHVGRSILIGPTNANMAVDPEHRLGEHGEVLYSSVDQIDRVGLASKLRPVEWAFNTAIVYGKRTYNPPGEERRGEAEVLLIDVFRPNADRLGVFKLKLWERFGLDSGRYEDSWDYEEYTRLAEPAFYALRALLGDADLPCVVFSHEFMGMPTALQAIMDGGEDFRTVFHAHECATARHIVEHHEGHDTMFYNVLDRARAQGKFVDDVFPGMDQYLRHALISRSHLCDGVIAVGDRTADEMKFLNRPLSEHDVQLVYNGVPAMKVDLDSKHQSRQMLRAYAKELLGYEPDVLMTHVTRPVISKGMWRDLRVCHELDRRLSEQGKRAVLFILTSAGGVRSKHHVYDMEEKYGWPRHHRSGYPDLVGPEEELSANIEAFNGGHQAVQVVLVNQFGWSRQRIGHRLPREMNIADLRRATDVEFGMATYEPFGISPLEPLGSGALCVISNVCGCEGFVEHVTDGQGTDNVIVADFTNVPGDPSIDELKNMSADRRNQVEGVEAARIADVLMQRLPTDDAGRRTLIEQGQALVRKMGWDQVCSESLIPLLLKIAREPE